MEFLRRPKASFLSQKREFGRILTINGINAFIRYLDVAININPTKFLGCRRSHHRET